MRTRPPRTGAALNRNLSSRSVTAPSPPVAARGEFRGVIAVGADRVLDQFAFPLVERRDHARGAGRRRGARRPAPVPAMWRRRPRGTRRPRTQFPGRRRCRCRPGTGRRSCSPPSSRCDRSSCPCPAPAAHPACTAGPSRPGRRCGRGSRSRRRLRRVRQPYQMLVCGAATTRPDSTAVLATNAVGSSSGPSSDAVARSAGSAASRWRNCCRRSASSAASMARFAFAGFPAYT